MTKRQVLMAVALPIVAGCVKNTSPEIPKAHDAALAHSERNWCRIDEIDATTQIISRYRVDGDRIVDLTLIRNSDANSLVSYPYGAFVKNSGDVPSLSYLAADVVKSSDDFERQAGAFQEFVKANPNSRMIPSSFNPDEAVEIKEYGVFSDSTSIAYPCSSYSGALVADTSVRPFAELSVYLGQTVTVELSTDSAISFSPLQLPIDPVDFSSHSGDVAGWCSWAGSDSTRASVKVLVVGKDKVIEAFTSSYPLDDPKDEAAFLKADLELSKIHKIRESSKNLSFDVEFGADRTSVQLPQTFQLIRDARGELALLSQSASSGAPPLIANATNLFFDCSDRKQVARYPQLPPNLNKLIDGLKQKL